MPRPSLEDTQGGGAHDSDSSPVPPTVAILSLKLRTRKTEAKVSSRAKCPLGCKTDQRGQQEFCELQCGPRTERSASARERPGVLLPQPEP